MKQAVRLQGLVLGSVVLLATGACNAVLGSLADRSGSDDASGVDATGSSGDDAPSTSGGDSGNGSSGGSASSGASSGSSGSTSGSSGSNGGSDGGGDATASGSSGGSDGGSDGGSSSGSSSGGSTSSGGSNDASADAHDAAHDTGTADAPSEAATCTNECSPGSGGNCSGSTPVNCVLSGGCYLLDYGSACTGAAPLCSSGTCICTAAACQGAGSGSACIATQYYGTRCGCASNADCPSSQFGTGACCDTQLSSILSGAGLDQQCYQNDPAKTNTQGGYYCLNGSWTNQ